MVQEGIRYIAFAQIALGLERPTTLRSQIEDQVSTGWFFREDVYMWEADDVVYTNQEPRKYLQLARLILRSIVSIRMIQSNSQSSAHGSRSRSMSTFPRAIRPKFTSKFSPLLSKRPRPSLLLSFECWKSLHHYHEQFF